MGTHKNPRTIVEYGAFKDGELVFRGSVHQLARHFCTHKDHIYTVENRHTLLDKTYEIRKIGLILQTEAHIKHKLTAEEKKLQYYTEHLSRYGNTVVRWNDNPKDILPYLEQNGFRCDMKSYRNYTGEDLELDGTYRLGKARTRTDYVVRWLDYDKQGIQSIV